MDKQRRDESKPKKQQPRAGEDESKRSVQEPGQVAHAERHGEADRQPEEPHGESEAV